MQKLLKKLKTRYPKYLHKLFNYGEMGLLGDDGIIAYDQRGISKKDIDMLFKMAMDDDFNKLIYNFEDAESEESLMLFAPCHALIALAEFEAHQFSQPLIKHFDTIDEDDDYYLDALSYFFAVNWVYNVELFSTILDSNKTKLTKKVFILQIFQKLLQYFEEEQNNILQMEEMVINSLKQDRNNHTNLNELALSCLIDIDGLKHIELIRWCFDNRDMGIADLEEIEHELGLRELKPFQAPNLQENKNQTLLQWLFTFWKK